MDTLKASQFDWSLGQGVAFASDVFHSKHPSEVELVSDRTGTRKVFHFIGYDRDREGDVTVIRYSDDGGTLGLAVYND